MKKILSILFVAATLVVSAQSTSPRFGTDGSRDNTGRIVTYGYLAPTISATTVITPAKSFNVYSVPNLTLSPQINFTVTSAYAADRVVIVFSALSASRTVTFAGNVKSAGTYTLGSGKNGTASFIFNGTNYVETSRFQEP